MDCLSFGMLDSTDLVVIRLYQKQDHQMMSDAQSCTERVPKSPQFKRQPMS